MIVESYRMQRKYQILKKENREQRTENIKKKKEKEKDR